MSIGIYAQRQTFEIRVTRISTTTTIYTPSPYQRWLLLEPTTAISFALSIIPVYYTPKKPHRIQDTAYLQQRESKPRKRVGLESSSDPEAYKSPFEFLFRDPVWTLRNLHLPGKAALAFPTEPNIITTKMCHRKIVTFLCHCPLRNMPCCPHSAHVIRDGDSKQPQDKGVTNTRTATSPSLSDTSTQLKEYSSTGKRLYWHKRQPQDAQGAVHWDPLQTKTVWYPCAGYIATHTVEGWAIPLHECEDCPEYYGEVDVETKEVGICDQCQRGHGTAAVGYHAMKLKTYEPFQSVTRSSSAPEIR